MNKKRRKEKKKQDRLKKNKETILRRRMKMRESARVERELERIRSSQQEKMIPFKKDDDETKSQLSD